VTHRGPLVARAIPALTLLSVLAAAVALRAIPVASHESPTGGDYGHLTHFARQYLDEGRVPESAPHFQLGRTNWAVLPGGPQLFAAVAAVGGGDPLDAAPLVLVLAVVEVLGVLCLGRRVLGRDDLALVAALVAAVFPSGPSMASWSAWGNLAALALFPWALLAWLECWDDPTPRSTARAALVVAAAASIHHLSAAVLGLSLALFAAVALACAPALAIRRLGPLALAGLAAGFPTLARFRELAQLLGSDVLSASRYDVWRIDWGLWARLASPLAIVALAAGLVVLARERRHGTASRGVVLAFVAVVLGLGFGWMVGLHLYYMRMVFFLPLAVGLAAAALVGAVRQPLARGVVALAFTLGIGLPSVFEVHVQAAFFDIVRPGVRAAMAYVRGRSGPGDAVVVSSRLAFHAPGLVQRPVLAAMPPDLVGNPQELPVAADAFAILAGLPGADRALFARGVRFVVHVPQWGDAPEFQRSRAVLDAHPDLALRYDDGEARVYEVVRRAR
jgi:hypothetical protein